MKNKIIRIRPEDAITDIKIEEMDGEPDLTQLQEWVGGRIEIVRARAFNEDWFLVVNEEGKLDGLEANPVATAFYRALRMTSDFIVGPVVLVKELS